MDVSRHTELVFTDDPALDDVIDYLFTRALPFGDSPQAEFVDRETGTTVPLPPVVADTLRRILDELKLGRAVMIEPIDSLLTVDETADVLALDDEQLVKLLKDGTIPSTGVGHSVRIRVQDALLARNRLDLERLAIQRDAIRDDPTL